MFATITPDLVLISLFVGINLLAFFIIARDKYLARRGARTERISEALLFFLAAAFGALGVYAGMILLRHKTQKWPFQLGIPLLIIQNLATIYLLTTLVSTW